MKATRIQNMGDAVTGAGLVTYKITPSTDPYHLRLRIDDVQRYGLEHCLRAHGVEVVGAPVPVYEGTRAVMTAGPSASNDDDAGPRKIGTVPALFDPRFIKSTSALYDPRPGDFTRYGDGWLVSPSLGPGDLDAVPGFMRSV